MKRLALSCLFVLMSCTMMVQTAEIPGGPIAAARNTWKLINWIPGPIGSAGLASRKVAATGFPVLSVQRTDGKWGTLFLTARHVIEDKKTNWQATQDHQRSITGGTVWSQHATEDAALVWFVTEKQIPVVYLDSRELNFTETVWAIGYPDGKHRVITQGIVSRRNMASPSVFPGNSGGPVIDYRGAVVGITQGMLKGRVNGQVLIVTHVMRFVPIIDLADWLTSQGVKH